MPQKRGFRLLFQKKYGIILTVVIALWSIIIMVHIDRKEKNKRFHDSHCRKALRHLSKHNKRKGQQKHSRYLLTPEIVKNYSTGRNSVYQLKAPCHLSIFDETRSSIDYFSEVLQIIK